MQDKLDKFKEDLEKEIETVGEAKSKFYTGYLAGLKRALFLWKCVIGNKKI